MTRETSGGSGFEQRSGEERVGASRSLLGRMLRLAIVLLVLALAAIAFVAADQYTIPFEYEGFD